jgi:uncharacterized protein YecE (DUF72 family)
MGLKIGTSGWQYEDWRSTFYPEGLAKSHWLEHYAARFVTVESNSAFYRLPERRTFADWAERTPQDFEIAVKASRYLTHVRRLREPKEPVRRLVERLAGLAHKRGPVLLQLPPNLAVDCEALDETLAAFPSSIRVAVEPRHPSWFVDDVRLLLEHRSVAWCLTDRGGPRSPLWRTTNWGYVRFHQGRASPPPCYGRDAIASWVDRITRLWAPEEDVYCYFNNDHRACAVRDAHRLSLVGRRRGVVTSRTPEAREVTLAAS